MTRSGFKTTFVTHKSSTKKSNIIKNTQTKLYITKKNPLIVSLTPINKCDIPNKIYECHIPYGTILYVSKQKHCNQKWYNNGKITKIWLYNVFLTEKEANDWINNYKCGEDKWIESSKIIQITLQK